MEKVLAFLRSHEETAYYHHLCGRILLLEGKFDEGLAALQKAVEASPREFIYFKKELAEGYLAAGRAAEAKQEALELLSFNPNAAEVLALLGRASDRHGESGQATRFFRQAQSSWRQAEADFFPLQKLRVRLENWPYAQASPQTF
jgi:Flp pilus assembly protein TadD